MRWALDKIAQMKGNEMILLIFGIYTMIAAKFQISRHYGLKGKGARVAGGVCIAFALGFFALFGIPIIALSQALGLGEGGAMALGFIFQIIALFAILFVLVRIYGNAFAKIPPPLPPRSAEPGAAPDPTGG